MTIKQEGQKQVQHLAIIMDGNRRWAKQQSLPIIKGHEKGAEKIKQLGEWCLKKGIRTVTVYALSTENLKRTKEEVSYLFKLLKKVLKEELISLHKQGYKLRVLGRWRELPQDIVKCCEEAMSKTARNTNGVLNVAINYNGRNEIVDAARLAIKENGGVVTEKDISEWLGTNGSPDPDLLIRTSGEQRLSGFLLWQLAYSELYFTPMLWPDFSERDLDRALLWYAARNRRYGQ